VLCMLSCFDFYFDGFLYFTLGVSRLGLAAFSGMYCLNDKCPFHTFKDSSAAMLLLRRYEF
jgi:hypothetical protein